MLDPLLEKLQALAPLSDALLERIRVLPEINDYPRKTLLLKEGQIANHACFVLKGLARAYYISGEKEVTSRFMNEGFIITSWISFYTRLPGYEYIEALEDITLACYHYKDIQQLYEEFPEFNTAGRKLTEHYFLLSEQRTQLLRKHTAEDKYQLFLEQYPDMLQRVALKYIASYLGINEETLSRVRSRLMKK